MFPLFGEIFNMEVCVDSVQSALNAERGGECLIFSVCLIANMVWGRLHANTKLQYLLHAVPERIFSERMLYCNFTIVTVKKWNLVKNVMQRV